MSAFSWHSLAPIRQKSSIFVLSEGSESLADGGFSSQISRPPHRTRHGLAQKSPAVCDSAGDFLCHNQPPKYSMDDLSEKKLSSSRKNDFSSFMNLP